MSKDIEVLHDDVVLPFAICYIQFAKLCQYYVNGLLRAKSVCINEVIYSSKHIYIIIVVLCVPIN